MSDMKCFTFIFIFLCGLSFYFRAQNPGEVDSLKRLVEKTGEDTNRVKIFLDISGEYYFAKPDSCLVFAEQALTLSRKIHFTNGQVIALNSAGEALRFLGDYPGALRMQFEALEINKENKNEFGVARTLSFIGFTYSEFREYRKALQYLFES